MVQKHTTAAFYDRNATVTDQETLSGNTLRRFRSTESKEKCIPTPKIRHGIFCTQKGLLTNIFYPVKQLEPLFQVCRTMRT